MKHAKPGFEIDLPDFSVNIEEWRKAQTAPSSELPELSSAQKEVARKLGITENAYARSVLAGEFGYERMFSRAKAFGECVARILEDQGSGSVDAVKLDPREHWLVRLKQPEGVVIVVPRDLVDDLLDSGSTSYVERLKHLIVERLSATREKSA